MSRFKTRCWGFFLIFLLSVKQDFITGFYYTNILARYNESYTIFRTAAKVKRHSQKGRITFFEINSYATQSIEDNKEKYIEDNYIWKKCAQRILSLSLVFSINLKTSNPSLQIHFVLRRCQKQKIMRKSFSCTSNFVTSHMSSQ